MKVTAYFQTVATVIPVLFIAGLMNPSLLREYSKNAERSRMLNKEIKHACIALTIAIVMVCVGYAYDNTDQLTGYWGIAFIVIVLAAMGYCAAVTGVLVFYIQKIVKLATEEYPHPDRLESEAKDLENRLTFIRSQQRKLGVDHSTEGGGGCDDSK